MRVGKGSKAFTDTNISGVLFYNPISKCLSFKSWLYWNVPGYTRICGWGFNHYR